MIVGCERCKTRFQLADSRVPDAGIRVRCSRCKHAFVVQREGRTHEDAVHAVAAEAARLGAASPPPATVDLDPAASGASGPASEEEDWTFNEPAPVAELPPAEVRRARRSALGDDPLFAEPAQEAPPREGLDAIGSPDSWDFGLADPGPAPPASREGLAPEPFAASTSAPPTEAAAPSPSDSAAGERDAVDASEETHEAASASPALSRLRLRGADTIRWSAAAALLLLVAVVSLAPRTRPGASRTLPAATVGALAIDEGRLRVVDNAVAGPMLVVSAVLRNPGAGPVAAGATVEVVLPDAEPGARAIAGVAPGEARLRLDGPEALRAAMEASAAELASRPLAPGEAIPVAAVFATAPHAGTPDAGSMRFEVRPAPGGAGAPEPAAAAPEAGPTAGASPP